MEAEIFLEQPFPADTLIIVELAGAMRDAHKVKNKRSRRFPLATTDTIASGIIAGILLYEEGPLASGVVELYELKPDSVAYYRRPIIRRTVTDDQGAYQFNWLPIPSGPFLVRAFKDDDGNLRPGENDPQRLLPDTLKVDSITGLTSAGVLTLYPTSTPGTLLADPFPAPGFSGPIMAWAMAITDADTGYYPQPVSRDRENFGFIYPDSGGTIEEVNPGTSRVIAFVDMDRDSSFSVIPDTLLFSTAKAEDDSVYWYLEPWVVLESVQLEPGLSSNFLLPAWTDSLTSWAAPEPEVVMPDSLEAALVDSLQNILDAENLIDEASDETPLSPEEK